LVLHCGPTLFADVKRLEEHGYYHPATGNFVQPIFPFWADSIAHRGILNKKSVKCIDQGIYTRKTRHEMQNLNPLEDIMPIGTSVTEANIFEQKFQNWRTAKKLR